MLNVSVNWLKTRYSPLFAGFTMASSTQRSVSRMFKKPRFWPPLPYTLMGIPATACTQKRLSAVPKTSS